jgi:hypothetical protein
LAILREGPIATNPLAKTPFIVQVGKARAAKENRAADWKPDANRGSWT